ncbi:hypothetical protein [Actinomadura rayongensis]|uniref:SH3 domain-containing protein n=1 Tax=Actinomadura rayongensis TaxID=1429076 RepID=A0A6I4W6K3_9ACTN|nr:hypothetical protein [Actinomadura rayongensis]MXQ64350.1 hypothetical protein [Actinomadura rayongensis]
MKRCAAVFAAVAALAGGVLAGASASADPAPVLDLGSSGAAAYGYGRVTASTLNIRRHATTKSRKQGEFTRGTTIQLKCWVPGEWIHGNNHWWLLGPGSIAPPRIGYVSAYYVRLITASPGRCPR